MKRIILAAVLLALFTGLPYAQKRQSIKQVQIQAGTIARQPKGKPYVVNLTRAGSIYTFNSSAGPIDFGRVKVRTAKGEMTMDTLLKNLGRSGSKLQIGVPKDIGRRWVKTSTGGGTANFTCQGLRCDCTGDVDCNDMFSSGVCGDIALCDENGCACLRI